MATEPPSHAGRPASAPPAAPARIGGAPAVSILMPAHDAARTLPAAIASVRAQHWTDWELLIADDGSADATGRIAAEAMAADPRIRLLRAEAPEGAAAARNRALAAARGRYIAFLDSDDLWLPEKLSRQIPFLEAEGAALTYTGFYRRSPGGRQRLVRVPERVDRARLLRGNVIGCLTAVYDSARIGRIPMRPIRRRQDFALWLDILERCPWAHGLDEPLAIYNVQARSLSSNKLMASRDTWRMYRDIAGLSRGQAALCLGTHLWQRVTGRPLR